MMPHLEWSRDIRRRRDGCYEEYRIPGIAITPRGTILLVCEARQDSHSDWGRIDILLDRGVRGGESWQTIRIAPGNGIRGGADDTFNNPTLIVDGDRVHLIFHRNYAQAYHCQSGDDGVTWSRPTEITPAFEEFHYPWNCCATGPGHGIALRSGRLVAPIWLANGRPLDPQGRRRAHWPSVAGAIYSDDRGLTWHAGALVDGIDNANETSVAELADGGVLFNFRSMESGLRRVLARSLDGSAPFQNVHVCEALRDPMCFGGMTEMDNGRIAFVHCDVGTPLPDVRYGTRRDLRVHVTEDGGASWSALIDVSALGGYADASFYDGCLYVFYELGDDGILRLVLNKYRL